MDSKIMAVIVAAIVVVAGVGVYFVLVDDKNPDIEFSEGVHLEIFGNADGNYVLDNKDVELIQDYIDEKIPESELIQVKEKKVDKLYYLADANLDGVVDSKDITYLKSIIDRSGKEMSFIDTFGHLATVPLNIEKVACDYFPIAELLQLVDAQDKIVAVPKALVTLQDYYLQGADLDKISNYFSRTAPDAEAVAEADPDVWILASDWVERIEVVTDAVVVGLDMLTFDFDDVYASSPVMSALIAGYMFNNVEAGQEYVKWFYSAWDKLNSKSSTIAKEDRPRVFYTGFGNYVTDPSSTTMRLFTDNTVGWQAVQLAGGYNIIDDHPTANETFKNVIGSNGGASIDLEWVADQEYDYLFAHCTKYTGSGNISPLVPNHGYTCDDPAEFKTGQKHLGTLEALNCEPENMYVTPGDYMNGASGGLLSSMLVAKVINADLYSDLNLQDEHQKYIDLMGFNYDLSENGVFFVNN